MVKEDVISMCPQTRFCPPALVSMAVGLTPAYGMPPSLLCQLASGFGQCEDSKRLGLQGKGAHRTALCCECPLQHGCKCPVTQLPRTAPLRCQLPSCDLGSGLWKPRCPPLALSAVAHLWFALLSPVWLSAVLSPLYLIPCVGFPLLRNDKVISLLDPDCSL